VVTSRAELVAQGSYIRLHDLSHYLAHEIRTPLTIIRGEIETELLKGGEKNHPQAQILGSALEEVTRIERIVSTVLRLSRKQRGGDAYRPTEVQILDWIQKNLATLERDSHLQIHFEAPKKTLPNVFLDPELLQLLLSNLFRNIRTHVGESAIAELRLYEQGSSVVIEISDNGPGLSDAQLLDVNQLDIAGEEIGLGLNLCKEISRVGYLPLLFENKSPLGLRVVIKCPVHHH
jgi:signal transduction histidine kinase